MEFLTKFFNKFKKDSLKKCNDSIKVVHVSSIKTRYSTDLSELNETLLIPLSIKTRKLLKEKGFSCSLKESCDEKIVLLYTEVSELADAVKKGLDTECEEIADIIIRASNFLCVDETFSLYCDLSRNVVKGKVYNLTFNTNPTKYSVIREMNACCADLNKFLEDFIKNQNKTNFLNIWGCIGVLVVMCNLYLALFHNSINLQECVNSKMDKNFKRPYKYNTKDEVKK